MNQKQREYFLTTDDDLKMGHVLDEDKIVDFVRTGHEEQEKDDEEDEKEDLDEKPVLTVTETRNSLNALQWGLLGRGFADHDNLLAKLEKASSQVLK